MAVFQKLRASVHMIHSDLDTLIPSESKQSMDPTTTLTKGELNH